MNVRELDVRKQNERKEDDAHFQNELFFGGRIDIVSIENLLFSLCDLAELGVLGGIPVICEYTDSCDRSLDPLSGLEDELGCAYLPRGGGEYSSLA
jgi:hypothetical protein